MVNQKNALVIGGTDGVGKEIAYGLAKVGCSVIIVGRDAEKANRVKIDIQKKTGNQDIKFIVADISLIAEANELADTVMTFFSEIHYLVHSAGIILNKLVITAEGIETNFVVNYLSRFAITNKLLALMGKSGKPHEPARILIISGAAMGGKIYFDDVNLTGNFSLIRFITQQCLANDLFTIALAKRIEDSAFNTITVNILKLGVVKTNIRKTFSFLMKWLVYLVFDPLFGQTSQQAAAPALELLLDKEYGNTSGALFLKIKRLKIIIPSKKYLDASLLTKMWTLSEQLIVKANYSTNK